MSASQSEPPANAGSDNDQLTDSALPFIVPSDQAENRADRDGDHAARQTERQFLMGKVSDENQRHRHQRNQRLGKNLESKIHGDESNRDAG